MALRDEHSVNLQMRPAHQAMDSARLGSHYPSRLSFMRVLTRTLLRQKWQITCTRLTLDDNGIGEIIYTINTPNDLFSFVVFTHELDPDLRSDRVIANRWDATATLCVGEVDAAHLELLRENVPKQEQGRLDCRSLVLTRANQSSRNFEYVVNQLASARQPSTKAVAKVGYLYRTTAVYGSGKFGMSDWSNVKDSYPDFARPFAAEMFACFMLRQASFDIVEHIAMQRSPDRAVKLTTVIKRYVGIGNATGLGMAPFLINHPLLINQWIECRELALARVRADGRVDASYQSKLGQLLSQAQQHLREIVSANTEQNDINAHAVSDLDRLISHAEENHYSSWESLIDYALSLGLDAQEILSSSLVELYPELVDDLEDDMCVEEASDIKPEQSLQSLKASIENTYDWALRLDFDDPDRRRMFWYRSTEKMEPRFGEINVDSGHEKQMQVAIGHQAQECYKFLCNYLERHPNDRVAHFLIQFPALRSIVRRVQTMSRTRYGEIRANLLDAEFSPTQLLRCKLSFFGVGKFDPQSRLWVRNTMFQGAPIVDDINGRQRGDRPHSLGSEVAMEGCSENWSFPLMPEERDALIE